MGPSDDVGGGGDSPIAFTSGRYLLHHQAVVGDPLITPPTAIAPETVVGGERSDPSRAEER